jgi:hypothetical protein
MEKHTIIEPKKVELKPKSDTAKLLCFTAYGKKHNLTLIHPCNPAASGNIIEWTALPKKFTKVKVIEFSKVTHFWAVEIYQDDAVTHIRCNEIDGLRQHLYRY